MTSDHYAILVSQNPCLTYFHAYCLLWGLAEAPREPVSHPSSTSSYERYSP